MNPVLAGFLGSLASGGATAFGAAAVFAVRRLTPALEVALLSVAAGIMLAATVFSLILPGLEAGTERFGSETAALGAVAGGLALGAVGLWQLERHLPHEHFRTGREGGDPGTLRRIWLFVLAITIHNVPEGMAVGVGFAGEGHTSGMPLALGIGLQNVPEGLAVAASLAAVGYSRTRSFVVAAASGLVEPLGGLAAAAAVTVAAPALPATLGLAAGAMLYVISDEIILETHRRETGTRTQPTLWLVGGFLVMMALDVLLG